MMALATQITGAILGVGAAIAVVFGPDLIPTEPIHIECTEAQIVLGPDSNVMQIGLTCHAGDAPVILTIPDVPEF